MQLPISKAIVTGGAGFIGSELVRVLLKAGIETTVVDNLVNGKSENLADVIGDIRFHQGDVRDLDLMQSLIRGQDVVFHLACLGVRHSIHSPLENHEVNATATLELLRVSRAVDAERFVYVSSSEVYGTALWAPMTEDHPTNPMTVYGASKLAGECYARAFYRTYDYPTVMVRPFNSFGPRCHHEGDSGEVIPKFLLRTMAGLPMVIFGDGSQTRDFTFVEDTARGIFIAGTTAACIGETVNIGSAHEIEINELARTVHALVGSGEMKVEYIEQRPGDVLRLYADPEKARALTGFSPAVSLKEGLGRLAEWYRASGVSAESMLEDEVVRAWKSTKEEAYA